MGNPPDASPEGAEGQVGGDRGKGGEILRPGNPPPWGPWLSGPAFHVVFTWPTHKDRLSIYPQSMWSPGSRAPHLLLPAVCKSASGAFLVWLKPSIIWVKHCLFGTLFGLITLFS